MSKTYYESPSFADLDKKFENHEFAIPQIQRRFVWNKRQVCDLLDSIHRHIPIGAFLTWRTEGARAADLKPHSNAIIPSFNYRNKHADIIIDGQQRLSSIYGILYGVTPKDEENSNLDFSKIYFNTNPTKGNRFFYSSRLQGSTPEYIQLTELLRTPPKQLSKRYRLSNARAKLVKVCFSRLKAYKFHSLIIETKDKTKIEETFIRINSKGSPAKRADILFARTSKFSLRDRVEEARRGLKYGFRRLKNDSLNSAIALISGERKIGKAALESFETKFNKKNIKKAEFKKD